MRGRRSSFAQSVMSIKGGDIKDEMLSHCAFDRGTNLGWLWPGLWSPLSYHGHRTHHLDLSASVAPLAEPSAAA